MRYQTPLPIMQKRYFITRPSSEIYVVRKAIRLRALHNLHTIGDESCRPTSLSVYMISHSALPHHSCYMCLNSSTITHNTHTCAHTHMRAHTHTHTRTHTHTHTMPIPIDIKEKHSPSVTHSCC